jgi:hypothetical protein
MKSLIATFRPQAWIDDYAVDIDGKVDFDVTQALLELPLEKIRTFKEHNHDSDVLADDLQEQKDHSGPFEVDVDIDKWLEENGLDGGRADLTQEQLDQLRRQSDG